MKTKHTDSRRYEQNKKPDLLPRATHHEIFHNRRLISEAPTIIARARKLGLIK